jgi:putative ABC transport system permease protein
VSQYPADVGHSAGLGREFNFRDTLSSPGVVLINEAMAKRYWPNEEAVGKRFKIGNFGTNAPWLTIVGVFKNVRHNGLDVDPRPQFWRPYSQSGWPVFTIVTKTTSAPATFIAPVKEALRKLEPTRPVTGARTMEEVVGQSVQGRKFPMVLLSIFALLALVLAAVGIAGVVGYSVIQRTQEIGVRIALGAQSRDVLRLVLGHSLAWTLFGIAIGVAASFGLLQLLKSLLFGITATDPFVLSIVSLLLVAVALLASYVPARRAMRVDPVSALRGE